MDKKTFKIVMKELDRILKAGGGTLILPSGEITMKQWNTIQSKISHNVTVQGLKTING